MIRRIGCAGAGLWAFLLPACMSTWNPNDPPYWVNANTGAPVGAYPPSRLPGTTVAAAPQPYPYGRTPNARIADGLAPMVQTGGTGLVDAKVVEAPVEPVDPPKDLEKPRDEVVKTPEPPKPLKQPARPPQENAIVIRPQWPNLGGSTPAETSSSAKLADNLTINSAAETPAPIIRDPAPAVAVLPPLEAPRAATPAPSRYETASPAPEPVQRTVLPEPMNPPAAAPETVLIKAVRAFQNNRPQEAVQILKQLDATNQDVLLSLMPLMVRLAENPAQTLPPDELAALVDRLQQATAALKAKAALRLERVCFCRAVRKYGDVEAFEPRHEFRPGDMVHLYVEIRNFTCIPVDRPAAGGAASPTGRAYLIKLATRLEICDAQGRRIKYWDLKKDDYATTPPQDYHHTYRLNIPDDLPPGNYTLWVSLLDLNKPDSPAVRQAVELRMAGN